MAEAPEIRAHAIYRAEQVAIFLGLSRETVLERFRHRQLRGWQEGRSWRTTGQDLLDYIAEQTRQQETTKKAPRT
jgi:hypothetical protein